MIFSILLTLTVPILIVGGLIYFFVHRRKNQDLEEDEHWFLRFALSRADALSQLFFSLSLLFFGLTLLKFNNNVGNFFSWQTILLITSVLGIFGSYYFKSIASFAISLGAVLVWWPAQATLWLEGVNLSSAVLLSGIGLLAIFYYSLGRIHEKQLGWKRFGTVYLLLGIIVLTGLLFFLSSETGLRVLGESFEGGLFLGSWQLAFTFLLIGIGTLGALFYILAKGSASVIEFSSVLTLALFFLAFAFFFQLELFQTSQKDLLTGSGLFLAVVFNLILFFELLGLIFSGYSKQENWLINMGAFFLFLLIIVKYFDWFFSFLNKSIFFIGVGILLFGVGWAMEKARRYMIKGTQQKSLE